MRTAPNFLVGSTISGSYYVRNCQTIFLPALHRSKEISNASSCSSDFMCILVAIVPSPGSTTSTSSECARGINSNLPVLQTVFIFP